MATSRPPAGWSTSGAGRRKSIAALPSWRVFRLGGTEISLDASWFIFFGVSAVVAAFFELPRRWSGAFGTVPDGLADVSHWAAGLLAAALIFGSILAHELAHFVRAKQLGIAAPKIRLYVFGDVVEPMHEPQTPKQEVAIAIAGPIVSAVLGGVCLGLARVLPDDSLPQVAVQLVGEFNLFLAGFSLLPGFPLDGGRVLRGGMSAVTHDAHGATRVASRVGMVLSIPIGLLGFFSFESIFGTWALLVAWFLWSAASSSQRDALHRKRLSTTQVRAVTRPFTQAPFSLDTSVADVWQAILSDRARPPVWPVADVSGEIAARVTRRDLAIVPTARRPGMRLSEVAQAIEPSEVLEPHMMLDAVLSKARLAKRGFFVVKEEGRVTGWAYMDDLVEGKRLGGAG